MATLPSSSHTLPSFRLLPKSFDLGLGMPKSRFLGSRQGTVWNSPFCSVLFHSVPGFSNPQYDSPFLGIKPVTARVCGKIFCNGPFSADVTPVRKSSYYPVNQA